MMMKMRAIVIPMNISMATLTTERRIPTRTKKVCNRQRRRIRSSEGEGADANLFIPEEFIMSSFALITFKLHRG